MSAVLHLSTLPAALLADSANDPDSTRKVYMLAGGLAVLGLVLIAITVWFWRNTRHDPELLGPLEAMGARKFSRLDSRSQLQLLDSVRPADAETLRGNTGVGDSAPSEPINLKFAKSSVAAGYDDLRDDAAANDAAANDAAADDADAAVDVDDRDVAPDVAPDVALLADIAPGAAPEQTPPVDLIETAVADRSIDRPDDALVGDATDSDLAPDSTAEIELDEFAILDSIRRGTPEPTPADVGSAKPAPVQLVIVPMDHDLPTVRPSSAGAVKRDVAVVDADPASFPGPATAEPTAESEDAAAAESPSSIDPLLRRRD